MALIFPLILPSIPIIHFDNTYYVSLKYYLLFQKIFTKLFQMYLFCFKSIVYKVTSAILMVFSDHHLTVWTVMAYLIPFVKTAWNTRTTPQTKYTNVILQIQRFILLNFIVSYRLNILIAYLNLPNSR